MNFFSAGKFEFCHQFYEWFENRANIEIEMWNVKKNGYYFLFFILLGIYEADWLDGLFDLSYSMFQIENVSD